MENILVTGLFDISPKHKNEHKDYEYYKREIVPKKEGKQCAVSVYEIPPGKSAYPYHYHMQNEECFYIVSGTGILRTPEGEKNVIPGDILYFPANEKGAHELTNSSLSEVLVYIDFDTNNTIDVSFYPDSKKVGIWGEGFGQVYKMKDKVDYYEGE